MKLRLKLLTIALASINSSGKKDGMGGTEALETNERPKIIANQSSLFWVVIKDIVRDFVT